MHKLLLILLLFPFILFAQHKNHEREHEHEHEHHAHKNELSIAFGFITKELTPGIHLHYIRGVLLENKIGLGISFETLFKNHIHNSISLIGIYRYKFGLTFAYAPGFLIEKHEDNIKYEFSQHLEFAYEIPIKKFHIGPQLDVGFEKEGVHLLLGVHFGIDF